MIYPQLTTGGGGGGGCGNDCVKVYFGWSSNIQLPHAKSLDKLNLRYACSVFVEAVFQRDNKYSLLYV